MEAVCDSSGQFVIRKDTDGRKVNDCLWAFMDDPGATASKTPYPSIDEMDAQGTRSFWYAAQVRENFMGYKFGWNCGVNFAANSYGNLL